MRKTTVPLAREFESGGARNWNVSRKKLANTAVISDSISNRGKALVEPFVDSNLAVTYRDIAYDREAAARLLNCFFDTGLITRVYFNDLSIPRVQYAVTHDNHFHVEMR